MFQTAVFVDAGYLYAQGAQLISGAKVSRDKLLLNPDEAAKALADEAGAAAPGARLLRIYWYDGLIRGGSRTAEQSALARAANVKLRLGMVNSRGEQKGVDSLIVTDLIELARNGAITDALILSGDEDIRVGVQVAQTYGLRAHLLGIKPALGSQSPDLVEEADTHREWDETVVGKLLSVKPAVAAADSQVNVSASVEPFDQACATLAAQIVSDLAAEHDKLASYIEANRGALPREIDRPALARLRDLIDRDLTDEERKRFRQQLRAGLRRG